MGYTNMEQWFSDAKFGIFIHWGIYAHEEQDASWPLLHHLGDSDKGLSEEQYFAQLHHFDAAKYNPEEWALLFKQAGAQYAVLTSMHHDGVTMWDSPVGKYSVVKDTPAGRDLVKPFCQALRKHNLRVGLYFSHINWSHPNYASLAHDPKRPSWANHAYAVQDHNDMERWNLFVKDYHSQVLDLCNTFNPDLLWFDGEWEREPLQWRLGTLNDTIRNTCPHIVINDRIGTFGDYATPEQGFPTVPPERPWEYCMTMNHAWGYSSNEATYKSPRELIRTFMEVISHGGKLLLNIGPDKHGEIPDIAKERLLAMGKWIHKNEEAVFDTLPGLPDGYSYSCSTLHKNKKTLYLTLFDKPNPDFVIKGLKSQIIKATVLGEETPVITRTNPGCGAPGLTWFEFPQDIEFDPLGMVVKLELDNELDIYQGKGRMITLN